MSCKDCEGRTTVKTTKLYHLKYDLIQKEGDQVVNIPIILGEGEDWEKLLRMAIKVKVDSVSVKVKPWDDFITPGGEEEGFVSGDYPVYMVMIDGNTLTDNEAMTISAAAVSGRYAAGRRCTGLNGAFGDKLYLTTFTDDLNKTFQKTTTQEPVDSDQWTLPNNVYQSGKIVVGINPKDFEATKESDCSSAARKFMMNKMRKMERMQQEKEAPKEEQPVKKSKKQPAPVDYSNVYKDKTVTDSDGKQHLYVDDWFWVETSANVDYQVKVSQ